MIRSEDRFRLPRGVVIAGDRLRDLPLASEHQLIGTAPFYVELLADGRSVGEIVQAVAERFNVTTARSRSDLVHLIVILNRAGLLNAVSPGPALALRRSIEDLVFALTTGVRQPALTSRHEVASRSPFGVIGDIVAAVVVANAGLWLGLAGVLVALALVSSPGALALLVAFEVGFIGGLVIHELGHVMAARHWSGGCFLLTSGLGPVRVVHRAAARRAWISAAGPILAGALGFALLLAGWALGQGILAVAALPPLVNLAGLTILFGDGRSVVSGRWRVA